MTPPQFENTFSVFTALREKLCAHLVVYEQQLQRLRINREALRETCDGTRALVAEFRRDHPTCAMTPAKPVRETGGRRNDVRRRRARPLGRNRRNRAADHDAVLSPTEERLRRFFSDDEAALPTLRTHAGLHFADLHLRVQPWTRRLLFLPAPLGEFALRNGFDPERVLADEDKSCELIAAWYVAHIDEGGAPDAALEAALHWLDPH